MAIELTAVGGGAFVNDHDLIMNAIANKRMCEIMSKYGQQVFLVMHKRGNVDDLTPWNNFFVDSFENNKELSTYHIKYELKAL